MPKQFTPIKMSDLMNKEFPPLEWLVEGLIPVGGITAIGGYPGSYKTWLMLSLAISSAQGGDFLGKFKTKKEKILIIDEESCERILQERLSLLTDEKQLDIEILSYSGFKIQDTDIILDYCLKNHIGIVMIDSLIRVHGLKDENSSAESSQIFSEFRKFKEQNISLIIIHHNRKSGQNKGDAGEELRGSSEIFASLDCSLSLKKDGDKITVKQNKLRAGEESMPFQVDVVRGEKHTSFEFSGYLEERTRERKTKKIEEKILELLGIKDGLQQKEIISALDSEFTQYSVKKALSVLTKNEKITTSRGDGNSCIYSMRK